MKPKKKTVITEKVKEPVVDQKTLKQQKQGEDYSSQTRKCLQIQEQFQLTKVATQLTIGLLSSLCSNGLPKGNIFEYAALHILKYQKKFKQKQRLELQDRIHLREKNKEIKKLMKSENAQIIEKKQYEAEQERIRKEEEEKKAKEEELKRLALEEEMADPFLRRGYKNFQFKQKNGAPPPKKGAPQMKKPPESPKGKKGKKK